MTEQLGKSVSENGSLTYSLYTDAKKMTSASGHYWDYGFCYNAPGEADERLDRLTYAFSTNGANISNYVLEGSRLESYIFISRLRDIFKIILPTCENGRLLKGLGLPYGRLT